MTPKKAIIIILTLFLIMVIVFGFLYFKKQWAGLGHDGRNNLPANSANQEKLSPIQQKIQAIEAKTNQQVEQIIKQGTTATGGLTADAQRKIEAAVNQAIMEKAKLKTPEQLKADQQRQAELDKIEQEINQRIKSQP